MTVREPHKEIVVASQMADSLQWLSFALILVFLAQIITALFPIALLQPEWMVRFSGSLRGIASLPLMALGLIMLANMIDDKVMPSSSHLQLLRRIASLAAIGFLLLIPLQSYGAVVGIRSQLQQVQGQLNSLTAAAELVQQASSEPQLRDAIRAIPGADGVADQPLGADVKTIKSALLNKLRESTNRLQTQLDDSKTKAIENIIPPLIRDAIISLAYAIGFAGMGYGQNGNSSLLRRLLNTNKRRLAKGRQLWGAERP
jgi:hypothetical protein